MKLINENFERGRVLNESPRVKVLGVERERDGKVQRGAEEEESWEGREKESDSRRSAHCQAQEQVSAAFRLRQAQAQALQEMAPSLYSFFFFFLFLSIFFNFLGLKNELFCGRWLQDQKEALEKGIASMEDVEMAISQGSSLSLFLLLIDLWFFPCENASFFFLYIYMIDKLHNIESKSWNRSWKTIL